MKPALQLVDGEVDRLKPADQLAAEQIAGAKKLLNRDISKAARWAWRELDAMVGPMLPGDFVVVGALTGNGKSSVLMSQMDAFASKGTPVLYVPLEVDPEGCRARWAAWKLGLNQVAVARNEWDLLPRGAKAALDQTLDEQASARHIAFAPPKKMTLDEVTTWCKWARREFDAKVIMLDHLHRLDFGGSTQNYRVSATEVVRRLKDLARELGVVMLAAAQLNRSGTSDPLDYYIAPGLGRMKETAAIGEEADVVLMLSRKLRRDLPDGWQQDLRLGRLKETELADANVMVVTCRKHRLDDSAREARALLQLDGGKIIGGRV